jgi:hypothetical protein
MNLSPNPVDIAPGFGDNDPRHDLFVVEALAAS